MERVFHGLREVILVAFVALGVYLFLSLLSYDLEDPGWRHTGTGRPLANAGGTVGAWLADLTFTLFGVMAFLLPVMVIWHGFLVWRGMKENSRSRWLLGLRWMGFIATVIAGTGLAYIHFPRSTPDLPETTGGILGSELGEWLLGKFGVLGATLALLVILLAGLTFFTGISWLTVMEVTGKCTLKLGAFFASLWEKKASNREVQATAPSVSVPAKPKKIKKREPKLNLEEQDSTPEANKKSPVITKKAQASVQTQLPLAHDSLPPLDLLVAGEGHVDRYSKEDLESMSRHVEAILSDFGVQAEVKEVHPGPVITRFEIQPAPGVKVSRISNLSKDLARSLSVPSVRIVEVIPGKSYVGLEIPNRERETVFLREVLASREYQQAKSPVTLVLGKDISGRPVVADLAKMPHLLVAGTTGAGKSVAINAMILSMLYKATHDQVRLIMIDPKMLELSVYEGIPHLLSPVVTDMKEAASALRWCVAEMERRYRLMSMLKVRNLAGYNRKIQAAIDAGEPIKDPFFNAADMEEGGSWPTLEPLPVIVVVIDELADMMMIVGKKVEELIARLAQKARAAGLHLILATQRPSVDVLTGLIKANVPTRIAFQVSSKIDSRTILDQGGAETLLGSGDMLFLPPGTGFPQRAHGAFVDDHEVLQVVAWLKQTGRPQYIEDITRYKEDSDGSGSLTEEGDGEEDELYDEAVRFVTETRRVSVSSVQRKFRIGYNRAARIVEEMERAGVVSPAEGNGSRTVLAPPPVED
ncbi:MAG: cell division protein FtsK [Methylothermaceae bacteria B42]|nr:MAG: cell division protein FtsK [Methylothermaceae bacteria B42]HHJ38484.1 DNA translocase FtsK [Methylothermaceae bacterium]